MSFFQKLLKPGEKPVTSPSETPAEPLDSDPARSAVNGFVHDPAHDFSQLLAEDKAKEMESFQRILSLPPKDKIAALLYALQWRGKDETNKVDFYNGPQKDNKETHCVRLVITALLRLSLPLEEPEFTIICQRIFIMRVLSDPDPRSLFPAVAARYKESAGEFSRNQEGILRKLHGAWQGQSRTRAWAKKITSLLAEDKVPPPLRVIRNGEVFAGKLLDECAAMELGKRNTWAWLLAHAADCSASKPTGKWEKRAKELIAKVDKATFCDSLISWLPLIDKPTTAESRQGIPNSPYLRRYNTIEICEPNLDVIKGLVWMAGLLNVDELTRVVGFVGVSAYKKVTVLGPRATRVGNACAWALANIGSDCALSQLAMMKVRVKFGSSQIAIGKALQTLANARGVTPEEIEEMSVPTYGMTEIGRMEESIGDYTAVLEVIDDKPVLRFLKPDGSPQKTIPTALKEHHAGDLKELKGSTQDLEKMLTAQKDRLDNLFLLRKSWPYGMWRQRYMDHPVVGIMARRLIWSFQSGAEDPPVNAIWYEGSLRDENGSSIEPAEDAIVQLWHPVHSDAAEIVRWRNWLFEHLVRQPFKQAHREIYILTDAERTTGSYSNRFASHILKQHQFNSLCAVRGWKNRLRLMVDDSYPPATRLLPEWGLRAEYWVEGVGDDYTDEFVTDSGAYRYLVTDQVRFYLIDAPQATAHASGGGYTAGRGRTSEDPLPIDGIPPIVLSEVLRDVDLFVGVTSVGNDPAWNDGGPGGRHVNYWTNYSFGELGASAEMRSELIATLLPRLKIAKQCHISGRFLVVKGALRTYKIHLGSGNILMKPDDRYLCIVKAPSRMGVSDVFLPFEGDSKLAVILSKAFLLAADTKITDPTILSQIRMTN